jgi:hypothetical protein
VVGVGVGVGLVSVDFFVVYEDGAGEYELGCPGKAAASVLSQFSMQYDGSVCGSDGKQNIPGGQNGNCKSLEIEEHDDRLAKLSRDFQAPFQ